MDTDRSCYKTRWTGICPYRTLMLMDDDTLKHKVRVLLEVEHLSIRQIAEHLALSRKKIMRVLGETPGPPSLTLTSGL